ncbi:MAG: outer membrane beta-barrel domain-containing protein [Deltaproteobacteria bacterium]|nr:outer membrane beta-barrel domain-containing protein [Deltaproteobacteria bacterium]
MRRVKPAQRVFSVAAAAALTLAPAFAFAQAEGDEGEVDPLASSEPAEPVKPAEPVVANGKAPFARVSDDQETIYAVQRKAFLVDGKFELTPMASMSFSDRFVQTFAPAASIVYHLSENFGLEVYGAYMFPNESSFTNEILNKKKLRSDTAKLTQMLWAAGVGVQWSPIYGKLQIFNKFLGNFNFYLGAGVGVGQTRVQCDNQNDLDPNRGFPVDSKGEVVCNPDQVDTIDGVVDQVFYEPNTFRVMGAFSGGVRFHFSTWMALKFEVKDYLFVARVYRPGNAGDALSDAVRSNVFAQIGLSFLLGGDED